MAGNERETVENRLLEVEFQKEAYSKRLKDIQKELDDRWGADKYPGPPPWTEDGKRYESDLYKEKGRIDTALAKVEVEIMECHGKLYRIDKRAAQAREKAAELEKSKNLPTPAPDQDKAPDRAQTPGQPEDKPRRFPPWLGWDIPCEPEIDDI